MNKQEIKDSVKRAILNEDYDTLRRLFLKSQQEFEILNKKIESYRTQIRLLKAAEFDTDPRYSSLVLLCAEVSDKLKVVTECHDYLKNIVKEL